jgi:hypothetical protein
MDIFMNTLLVVPSRGRPQNIKRLYSALINTESQLDLLVGIDEDDTELEKYKKVVEECSQDYISIQLRIGPRKRFAPTVNDMVMELYKQYTFIIFVGDDHLPITLWWDTHYREALKELGAGVVYGNDLVMGEHIATEWAITSNMIEALGYYIPEGFIHLFIDNYFMELGRSIGKLRYLPNIIVQHLHPCAGTSEEDQTYKEANSPANWDNDRQRFEDYKANELPRDKEKLERLISNE